MTYSMIVLSFNTVFGKRFAVFCALGKNLVDIWLESVL